VPLDAVVFDVDGTLVDSERDGHRVAFNLAFEETGLPDHWDVDTYGRLLRVAGGMQRLTAWFEEGGLPAEDARNLADRLHPLKTDIMRGLVEDGRVRPRPGVLGLLDDLAAHGVRRHVATTGTRAWVEPLLDRLFPDRFDVVVTGSEVHELKPDPAVYREVLAVTGCAPDRAVAVEDSANGVIAAVGAGLRCVAVTNTYTRDHDLGAAELVVEEHDDPALTAWFRRRGLTGRPPPREAVRRGVP